MPTPLVKLNEHINQLVIWLRENPNVKLQSSQKKHLISILNKVINGELLGDDEVRQIKESIEVRKVNVEPGYIICPICKEKYSIRETEQHIRKCKGHKEEFKSINHNKSSKGKRPKKGKYQGSLYTESQRNPYAEYREERKLDGAKDYYNIRDNGEFGSYPTYDNMGDESYS